MIMQIKVFTFSSDVSWRPALGEVNEKNIELRAPRFEALDRPN
jgi:hypothetical protein